MVNIVNIIPIIKNKDTMLKKAPVKTPIFRLTIIFLAVLVTASCTSAQPDPIISHDARATATEIITMTSTIVPAIIQPATGTPSAWIPFTNQKFGIRFEYPGTWFGPEVYETEDGVRIEVGSDVVYPYGTDRTEQVYELLDAYYVVIQYTENRNLWTLDQFRANQPWSETYFTILDMQDGESRSGMRELITRVRQIQLGKFAGVEFISTLSETAQTERFYVHQVMLFDEQMNALTIMGIPNNVEVTDQAQWRVKYQQVDEANLEIFYHILDSLSVE